jgi:hypothetical protein
MKKTVPGNSAAQGRILGPVVLRPNHSVGLPLGLRRKCQAMFGAKAVVNHQRMRFSKDFV